MGSVGSGSDGQDQRVCLDAPDRSPGGELEQGEGRGLMRTRTKIRTAHTIHRVVFLEPLDFWCARQELNLRPAGSKLLDDRSESQKNRVNGEDREDKSGPE